jgi:hypothetical protein
MRSAEALFKKPFPFNNDFFRQIKGYIIVELQGIRGFPLSQRIFVQFPVNSRCATRRNTARESQIRRRYARTNHDSGVQRGSDHGVDTLLNSSWRFGKGGKLVNPV